MDKQRDGRKLFLLTSLISISIIVLDQIVKARIVALIPENRIGFRLMNDFLWIVHTRNLGIAFSIGDGASRFLRILLFILIPGIFLVAAVVYGYKSRSLSLLQRITLAFIVGGGGGNLVDRVFRSGGVVDFLSFSLFGIFGLDRFPTFNIADLCISVGAAIMLLSGFLGSDRKPDGDGETMEDLEHDKG